MAIQSVTPIVPVRTRARAPKGFSLVELVTVIVILGVIAAVAVPRFVGLSADSERAAVQALVGAVQTSQQTSFAMMLVKSRGNPYLNSPGDLRIIDFVQCDSAPLRMPDRSPFPTQQLALAEVRRTLFLNPNQGPVCLSGPNQIRFTTKSGRIVTISNGVSTTTWSASPPY
ncbi:MAG: type II secretion system protein [Proteobacteria bacterium]|nr:type II secretion system protein [Burkholderiales bacterium]